MPSASATKQQHPSDAALLPFAATLLWESYLAGANPPAPSALDRLYRVLHPELIAFCRRKGFAADLAEEVAQQAWARLIERRPQSRSFIALLRKTAQNLGLMALREQGLRERPTIRPVPREEPECDPVEAAERSESLQAVRDCLSRLNDEDRVFLLACDVDGLSRRKACERLGWDIAASTAHQRHVRIRAQLAAALEKR